MLVTFSSATTALRCVTGLLVVFVTDIIILALLTMVPMVPDRSYAEVFVTSPSQQPPPLTLRTANAFSQAVDDFIQHFTVRTKHLHPPSTVAANKMKHDSKHQAALSKQKLADSKKNPHVSHGDMETLARKLDGFANPPSTTTPTTPTPPTPPTPPTHPQTTYIKASAKLSDYYNNQLQPDVSRQFVKYEKKIKLQKKGRAKKAVHMKRMHRRLGNIHKVFGIPPKV